MDAAGDKQYFLSTAPQCPYPDAADNDMLAGAVAFDFIMIQFYNNYCGLQSFALGSSNQNNFNYATWDNWAHTASANKNVRILLGMPGNTGAGAGYTSGSALQAILNYCKGFSSFGGVMIWDMSQTYANTGFLDQVANNLGGESQPQPPPPSPTSPPPPASTTFHTSTIAPTPGGPPSTLVPQWGQCGGVGYTGSTQCAPPYTCAANSQWWSQCQ